MIFFKKIWFFVLAGLIVCGLGTHIFLRGRTPTEPIKIYRTTHPPPKNHSLQTDTTTKETPITHDHSHDYPHDADSHDHTAVSTTKREKSDWRDDSTFETLPPTEDPWENIHPKEELTDADDTYPPRNWYKTEDPELHAEYFYAQLLKQFGDIPEVHIIAEHKLQIAKQVPITVDQWIKYLEASQVLWPNEKNAELLEALQKDKVEEHQ